MVKRGKPETQAEKLVDTASDRWRDRLWLKQWDMTIRFVDRKPKGGKMAAGAMEATPRYKTLLIEINSEWLKDAKASKVEDTVCHEMVHAVLTPLQDVAKAMLRRLPRAERKGFGEWLDKENESVATHLEQVLRREAKWPRK